MHIKEVNISWERIIHGARGNFIKDLKHMLRLKAECVLDFYKVTEGG